ncbi:MAG: zinc metallopeptidase [Leadbetterella sp.]
MIMIISLVFMGLGMLVSGRLKSKFAEYSRYGLANGMSGQEIAAKMLRDNNIMDVKIIQVDGQLTDHYNPLDKTVNLSNDVFHGRSASAAAVAAHEVGHAIQHATAYAALTLRSKLVPVVNIANNVMGMLNGFLFMGGMYMLTQKSPMASTILLVLIVANGALALFATITLPVEFDASNRALKWMESNNVVTQPEHAMAKDALKWAAMTYVVGALAAIANLLYYVMIFLGRRND